MDNVKKKDKNTHHGHAIKRLRQALGIKQEKIAMEIGVTQQAISAYERRSVLEDDILNKIAKSLGVTPQLIKDLDVDPVTIVIENNTFENNHKVSNIGNYSVVDNSTNQFNPVDRIMELCEKILKAEQEKIVLLKKLLNNKK